MGFVDIFMKQNLRLPGRYPFEIVIDLPVFLIADGISPIGRNTQKTIPAEQPKPRLNGGNGGTAFGIYRAVAARQPPQIEQNGVHRLTDI